MSANPFRSAQSYTDRHGLFVAVTGGTNSGKSFSAMRLARGIAGPSGRIAVLDTEGGRMLNPNIRKHFTYDATVLDPPHRPEKYSAAAAVAEANGYDVLVIDSFSMEWVGLGGVLDWQAEEYERLGAREAIKLASWIKPKAAHKAMLYSLLQRRIPIIFSMRAEQKAKKEGSGIKTEWEPICNKAFPFEVTVSFMLMQDAQGIINLKLPHKLEGDHRAIFRDGEQLSEEHGRQIAAWAVGGSAATPSASAGPADATPDRQPQMTPAEWLAMAKGQLASFVDVQTLDGWWIAPKFRKQREALRARDPALYQELDDAYGTRRKELEGAL